MNKFKNFTARLSYISTVLAVCALASCSSDDGNTSLGGVNIPTKAISIDSSNANMVAMESNDVTDRTNTATSVVAESNSVNSSTSASTAHKASNLVQVLAARSNSNDGNFTISAVQNCPNGGTFTSPDAVTGIGDYVYDNCQFADFTVTGSISITGTGDLINGSSFEGSFSYNELTIVSSEFTSIFDGTMNINYSVNGDITQGTYEIPSLTYTFGDEGVQISNYSLSYYEDLNEVQLDFKYKISSTLIGGSVDVETTQTFKAYTDIAYDYPYAGQIVIRGADNTKARLTVEAGGTGLETDFVRIEIDADGNDTYEESRILQWKDM